MLAHCIRNLADSILLPHDFEAYGDAMEMAVNTRHYDQIIDDIENNLRFWNLGEYKKTNFTRIIEPFQRNIERFTRAATRWNDSVSDIGISTMYHS